MDDRLKHPVWGVYDLYRTARLNVKYYSARLNQFEKYNFTLELILLISAPSSAIAGLWFWNTSGGEIVWKFLGVLAAIVAVLKPLLGLNRRIKAYEEVLAGYRALDHDLYEIKEMVAQKQKFDKELQTDFRKALKRKGVLVNKNPETVQKKNLKTRLVREVNNELPPEQFYVPDG